MGRWAPCGYTMRWFAEAPPRSAPARRADADQLSPVPGRPPQPDVPASAAVSRPRQLAARAGEPARPGAR